MGYVYRNSNNGDEVERDQLDPYLDQLDNWSMVKPGDDGVCPHCGRGPEVVGTGILSRPGMRPDAAPAEVARPAIRAGKPEWIAYAVALGLDEAEAQALTRDELVARYRDPADATGE